MKNTFFYVLLISSISFLPTTSKAAETSPDSCEQKLKAKLSTLKTQKEIEQAELEIAKAKAAKALLIAENKQKKAEAEKGRLEAQKESEKLKRQLDQIVPYKKQTYPNEIYSNGHLKVSDRRIPFNGPVTYELAQYVEDRIHFYNNKNKKHPIFIVIDSSPGGSVMAGFRILQAMKSSKAPVYVLVKSYAASMAAGITTLAEKSFAYPDAIILHHQMISGVRGNMSELKEHFQSSQKWYVRMAKPVADKMGISLDEFVEKMYEATVSGDWEEFADEAQKLKWVDHVITSVEEADFTLPEAGKSALELLKNESGKIQLPSLNSSKDEYYLHDPNDLYEY